MDAVIEKLQSVRTTTENCMTNPRVTNKRHNGIEIEYNTIGKETICIKKTNMIWLMIL